MKGGEVQLGSRDAEKRAGGAATVEVNPGGLQPPPPAGPCQQSLAPQGVLKRGC